VQRASKRHRLASEHRDLGLFFSGGGLFSTVNHTTTTSSSLTIGPFLASALLPKTIKQNTPKHRLVAPRSRGPAATPSRPRSLHSTSRLALGKLIRGELQRPGENGAENSRGEAQHQRRRSLLPVDPPHGREECFLWGWEGRGGERERKKERDMCR
jgi:hypothetical protein